MNPPMRVPGSGTGTISPLPSQLAPWVAPATPAKTILFRKATPPELALRKTWSSVPGACGVPVQLLMVNNPTGLATELVNMMRLTFPPARRLMVESPAKVMAPKTLLVALATVSAPPRIEIAFV